MIASLFHKGSGIGNQLHRYVMARVVAKDRGFEFGMINPENSKMDFMKLDMGVPVNNLEHQFQEEVFLHEGVDIRPYDSCVDDLEDFTLIDGEFQGELYYQHRLNEIREWLAVEPLNMPEDVCVIGFRGGEYVGVKDLFLPQEYWDEAIAAMRYAHPHIKFEVHTDEILTAQRFFPDFPCIHDAALNWRSVRYAKHLIIANSSFYILPSLLGEATEIIAPKFWAGYNKGFWQLEQNQYNKFKYI